MEKASVEAVEDEKKWSSAGLRGGVRETKTGSGKRKHEDEALVIHGESGSRKEETDIAPYSWGTGIRGANKIRFV